MKLFKTYVVVVLLTLLTVTKISAQETVIKDKTNTWFTMLNRLNINEKWSVSNELHERTGALLSEQATFLWRPSVEYHLNADVELVAGYSLLLNEPNLPYVTTINTKEHNVWEQILLKNHISKINIQHRIRQEHRWNDAIENNTISGTTFSNRFRYRLTANTPIVHLKNNHEIFAQVFDEIWVAQTNNLMPSAFKRNWFYAGVGYKFNAKANIQLGYMNQWDAAAANSFINTHIIQTTFVKNFNL